MGFDANVEFLRITFWQIIITAGPLLAVAQSKSTSTYSTPRMPSQIQTAAHRLPGLAC